MYFYHVFVGILASISTIALPAVKACSPGNLIIRPTASVLIRKMGPLIREIATIPDKPDGQTVTTSTQLTCSSSDIRDCCWRQGRDSVIDWTAATGRTDAGLMQLHFRQAPPQGAGFIVSYSNTGRPRTDSGILESCKIPCVKGDITLRVESWQSDVTRLDACVVPADTSVATGPPKCVSLQKGADSVTIKPLKEEMRLVLRSYNFVEPTGSIVAMDDLVVLADIQPASECVKTEPIEVCKKLTCNFNSNSLCNYRISSSSGPRWEIAGEKQFGTLNTGIRRRPARQRYAGVKLRPGETARMESELLNVQEPLKLRFKAYEATQNMRMKICRNSPNDCPWQSNPQVKRADYSWISKEIDINENTDRIIFIVESIGEYHGAAGVDNIELYTTDGKKVNC